MQYQAHSRYDTGHRAQVPLALLGGSGHISSWLFPSSLHRQFRVTAHGSSLKPSNPKCLPSATAHVPSHLLPRPGSVYSGNAKQF